ncbi:bifunctional ADP-dependent NAD(P)H-hydrate dehydratase/NAD(P)H-hydrate epimerase [Rhodococcoides kyotonense]|uniref:Bifunctional NAD(P)H-hydrate repair enzyme n=1 Tax=Rhodococcoides kyotonense TaxID=398843 RepID=A0A177Y701_9NOCA|nr:bifunctional ADP-dependent NAD(P)H-hydrate dehydratase/NAD(P)H-hydrate epimerase [Rhodococcus kyotonensis]OAK50989.1 bifunctional ADP-dependent (S)-NAD(P)H-hydrate dehydratase/NAD(P)H-hydrate epimerase [Rhodococcus kyotonensis]
MRGYYTPDQVRDAERPLLEAGPPGALMRRAAYGLTNVVVGELLARTGGVVGREVCVLVGSGDNGGDGLWAGAMLRQRGVAVKAVLLKPDRAHAEGLAAFRRAGGKVVESPGQPDLVVDAIVGISGKGPLRRDADALVSALDAPIVAADIPSGVDPETGSVDGPAVRAAVTVAFGARKPAHVLAVPYCGRVELVDIGLDLPDPYLSAFEPADVGALWPIPRATDDKYTQGVVGVSAGSDRYPGAALLCTGAAVAATSGMVRYVGSAAAEVVSHYPEVIAASDPQSSGRVQAWAVGPGFGTDDVSTQWLTTILATDLPVVVDADGLTVLASNPELVRARTAPTLLTPHAGEFERLTGQAPGPDRVAPVRALAAEWGVTVLLKGRATVIADPDGNTYVNDAGGSAASTAGSGDVLSGILGALLASGMTPSTAAACGARVHALAAATAAHGVDGEFAAPISASPLLSALPDAIRIVRSVTTGE